MRRIWLHIREQSTLEDRQLIRKAVRHMESHGLVRFEGSPWEQSKSRSDSDRTSEIALETTNAVSVRDFLLQHVGDACWIENESSRG